jgi:hypothetical protein
MPNLLDMLNNLGTESESESKPEGEDGNEDLAPTPSSSPVEGFFNGNPLLASSLLLAIPLWIEEVRPLDWKERIRRAHVNSFIVAAKGDILMFGGGKKGQVAEVFNATAEGIAILSFVPGGVKIFGMHFEADPPKVIEDSP